MTPVDHYYNSSAFQNSYRYPERAKQSLHHTNVYVPASVAALLEVKPQLIAPAAVAFCDRDMIDSKVFEFY